MGEGVHGGGGEGEVGTSALCRNNGKLEEYAVAS